MHSSSSLPREGMMALVRNRRGLIANVEAFPPDPGPEGRLHLVRIAYTDPDGSREESLIWEREAGARLIESQALPAVTETPPMDGREFNALVRASRWSALTPTLELAGLHEDQPMLASPFFGALQLEDYQLVPLLRALRMPRVTLLLADGVGLGKTVECGLILRELMLRRRIRRVLILCPATLRRQWQQEMQEKFAVRFDLIDRKETLAVQKRLGIGANPWKVYEKAIVSYQYLRQPDVFEQFRAAAQCSDPRGRPQTSGAPSTETPWDLLIVDEAHNLSPGGFGPDSELSRMLRKMSPWFEHRVFLSATPHNGHTRSFSGLLEALDPVRFSRTSSFTPEEKQRIEQVVLRRLKRDLDRDAGKHRFTERQVVALPDLDLGNEERALVAAFEAFRQEVRRQVRKALRSEALAGAFAVEVLSKRLLSGPATFAESWWRCMEGLESSTAARSLEVRTAKAAVAMDLEDDEEREARARHALSVVGAWLSTMAQALEAPIVQVNLALEALGMGRRQTGHPTCDARFERLKTLCDSTLLTQDGWRPDERLIVFTEYKTSLDYLARRLDAAYGSLGDGAIRILYGGMRDEERQRIKAAFNDPDDPLRILVATDAASEGLNLQSTCRYLLHWDIPWNPSRMEQRNGRLDRHGQARDVTIFHFTSEDDDSLRFMGRLLNKRSQIREDRIMADPLFSEAIEAHFLRQAPGEDLLFQLDEALSTRPEPEDLPPDPPTESGMAQQEALKALAEKLDLSPSSLQDMLEIAMSLGCGLPRMEGPDERGRFRLVEPVPSAWLSLIQETLTPLAGQGTPTASYPESPSERPFGLRNGLMAELPRLTFDPQTQLQESAGRTVFRPEKNTFLMHLGHPILQQALGAIARARYQPDRFSRWIARCGPLPEGAEAAILLTVEELAANLLQETSHHWVRTFCFPIRDGALLAPLESPPPRLTPATEHSAADLIQAAQQLWRVAQPELETFLERQAQSLTERLSEIFQRTGERAIADETLRFQERLAEIGRSLRENTLAKLEREHAAFVQTMRQTTFLVEIANAREQRLFDLTKELELRRRHYKELRTQLEEERDRLVERVLPARYHLKDRLQVLPIAVEIRFPEVR
ncbi:RNA polymerase-associated protein RapA [compost metagenome]